MFLCLCFCYYKIQDGVLVRGESSKNYKGMPKGKKLLCHFEPMEC